MHQIAQKTKQETESMRIITLVTLFFLPGTFISVRPSIFPRSLSFHLPNPHPTPQTPNPSSPASIPHLPIPSPQSGISPLATNHFFSPSLALTSFETVMSTDIVHFDRDPTSGGRSGISRSTPFNCGSPPHCRSWSSCSLRGISPTCISTRCRRRKLRS
jgi:hypothetical protein